MPPWVTDVEFGPYVLVAPIGAGGMGEVWKARDTRLDRVVAIKRLHGQHSARFEQEARDCGAESSAHLPDLRHRTARVQILVGAGVQSSSSALV